MKKLALFFVSFWVTLAAHAECDSYLKLPQENPRKAKLFQKDCEIQDRYGKVKNYFAAIGINIAELAEYRLLRFVDRTSYESARQIEMMPSFIYKPAPTTWEVWDSGIRSIFGDDDLSFVLFKTGGFESRGLGYDHLKKTNFNAALLKNSKGDISRNHLDGIKDSSSVPGTYRHSGDDRVGWTASNSGPKDQVLTAQESMREAQALWENSIGVKFSDVVEKYKGKSPAQASFAVNMTFSPRAGGKYFVGFASSDMVPAQISWLNSFVKANIELYRIGKPVMPPIEFSALVQKWLVTIHPFSDGNGRTSRAAQDIILANFKMPYSPGGDLQNDVLETFDRYVDQTYYVIETMVRRLENCAEEYRQKKEKPSYGCRTVKSLEQKHPWNNKFKNLDEVNPSFFQQGQIKVPKINLPK